MYMTIQKMTPTITHSEKPNTSNGPTMSAPQSIIMKAPMNIIELEDKFEIYLMMPGFSKDDVKISLTDNVLEVKAEIKVQENVKFKIKEFGHASLTRSVALSDKLLKEDIHAEMSNGILKLTILKAPELQPKVIEVK